LVSLDINEGGIGGPCNGHGIYQKFHFFPNAPHVLVDFVVFPPGHGRILTDF